LIFKFWNSALARHVLLLLLLVAFFLRVYHLDGQSLRGDEAATVLYSALPVNQLWELSRVTDPHPPLYYLMLHPWQWLAGESAWAMRFAGVVASTTAIATLYALARRTLRTTGVSLLAAALLALNPLQIWLAQDIRSYPFFTLLGLLSSWTLWQALNSSQRSDVSSQRSDVSSQRSVVSSQRSVVSSQTKTRYATSSTFHAPPSTLHLPSSILWPLYILLTLTCFYIHYYTAFLIAFQGLFVLLNYRRFWEQKWPWLASQVAIGVLMIPGLQLAYNFVGQAAGGIETIATPDIIRLASTSLLTGFTLGDTWGLWLSLILAPIWLIGLISLLRHDITSGSFWALFFAVPVLGVIALSIDRPFFKERFLIQAQPAFELLLAAGFLTLSRSGEEARRRESGKQPAPAPLRTTHYALRTTHHTSRLLTLLLLAFLLYTNLHALGSYFADPAYAKAPPWQLYHNYVSDHAHPGDVMLTNFPEAAVSYYSPNELPFYVVPVERDQPAGFRLEQTEQIAQAYRRIWFLPLLRQGFDEQGDVLKWLDRHADRVNQVFFPIYNLNLYLSPPTIDTLLINQPAIFAHGPRLRGYQIFDKEGNSRLTPPLNGNGQAYMLALEPEEALTLSLYWLSSGPTGIPYTVFAHLIAADGFNRAGQDNPPVWGSYPTTAWQPGEKITDKYTLTIPPGTPPSDHHLQIGWYNPITQERVPLLSGDNRPGDDSITLNVIIRVEP
jgi:hypothetical protein